MKIYSAIATLSTLYQDDIANGDKSVIGDVTNLDMFLLKIDTEGYDYFAIDGASELLENRRVQYLSFEYNLKWFT